MVNFNDFGKVMVRSPLFPFSLLFHGNGTTKDLDELTDHFLEDEPFLEGIYWSSIPLYNLVLAYKQGKDFTERKRKKLFHTLQKYIIRSSSRPTPFGTFAGVCICDISGTLSHKPVSKRHLRIDSSVLKKMIQSIEDNPLLVGHLNFHLNNTLYTVANQFRFLEVDKNDGNKMQISSLEKTVTLKRVVSLLKKEEYSFDTLYDQFCGAFDRAEFYAFFQELVSMGFLVSELELAMTAENPFTNLKKYLSKTEVLKIPEAAKYQELLDHIQSYIIQAESNRIGKFTKGNDILLKESFENIGIHLKDEQIFQVDLFHSTEDAATLTPQELNNIKKAIVILGKVTTGESKINADLEKFKSLFSERYETKPIPLLDILDADIGIGFPVNERIGNNVKDFPLHNYNTTTENLHNLSDWLINKIEEAAFENKSLEIKDKELQNIAGRSQLLSNTFSIAGQLLGNSKILLQNVGGASATSLLSRFAYMDPEMNELCRDVADYEKNISKTAIIADILWVSSYKTGNISRRISHYDYEIPIYYRGSKEKKNIILLEDILVSVEQNEIILTSKKLKTRIIPVLSNAHNFPGSKNPIYKFLTSLQYQNTTELGIKYDFSKIKKRFFPRIFYKNIILFPAHWIIQTSDIEKIIHSNQKKALHKFFERWKVAQYVTLSHGDNELFLDIYKEGYLQILLEELKKGKPVILKEWLTGPPCGPSHFIRQFVLPLKKETPTLHKRADSKQNEKSVRSFFPGSEWAYFKIYCSSAFSDIILKRIYNHVLNPLKKEKKIHKWFFIRYHDPHYHLRVRLHLAQDQSIIEVTKLVHEKLERFVKNQLIWRIQMDTYQREIERYGWFTIEKSERIFHLDSELFMRFLNNTDLEEDSQLRLLVATKNMDTWLSMYGFDIIEKKAFCKKMAEHFAKEKSAEFLSDAREKYKVHKNELFEFLNKEQFSPNFETRSREITVGCLTKKNLADHIHLSLNRWFMSQQREWEYLTYYFCGNYYSRMINTIKTK